MRSTPHAKLRLVFASLLTLAVVVAAVLLASPTVALSGPRIVSTEAPEEAATDPAPDAAEPADAAPAVTATIIVAEPASNPAPARRTAAAAPRQPDVTGLEFGIRVGTFAAGDDWIDPDGTANYGGFGMDLRWRFDPDWSLEVGFDGVHRDTETDLISESRFLFNLGALYYLGDVDWWQTYISFGFQSSETELSGTNTRPGTYSEMGVYGGFGADFYLDDWRLNTELRVAGMGREDGDLEPYQPAGVYTRTAPDGRGAVQWFFGALYSF